MCQQLKQLKRMAELILKDNVSSIRLAAEKVADEAGISKKQVKERSTLIRQLINSFKQSPRKESDNSQPKKKLSDLHWSIDDSHWSIIEAKFYLVEKRSKIFQKKETGSQNLDKLQRILDNRQDKKCWPYIQLSSLLLKMVRFRWRELKYNENILWRVVLEHQVDALQEILTGKGNKTINDDDFLKIMAIKVEREGKSINKAATETCEEYKLIIENRNGCQTTQSLITILSRKFKNKYPHLTKQRNAREKDTKQNP